MVMVVPPASGPEPGETPLTVGGPIGVTELDAADAVPVPATFTAATVKV